MPDDAHESSFMRTAERQVNALVKQSRHNKAWNWVLAAVCVLLILAVIQTRANAIASCRAGNSYRASQTQIWQEFIDLATHGQKQNARSQQIIHDLLAFVDKKDAPRECSIVSWP
jgi:hypothetical protein